MERLQLDYASDSDDSDNGTDNEPQVNVNDGTTTAEATNEPVDTTELQIGPEYSSENNVNIDKHDKGSGSSTEGIPRADATIDPVDTIELQSEPEYSTENTLNIEKGSESSSVEGIQIAEATNEPLESIELQNEPEYRSETILNIDKGSESSSADFFGLLSAEHDTDETEEQTETDRHAGVVKIDGKDLPVAIPSSSFWSDVGSADLQVLKETGSKFVLDKRKRLDTPQEPGRYKRIKSPYRAGSRKHRESVGEYSSSARSSDFADSGKSSSAASLSLKPTESRSVSDRKLYFIHSKIQPLLHTRRKRNQIPSTVEWTTPAHGGAVNRLKWNIPAYSHLLATCSMDSTIKIWNPWTQLEPCVQVLSCHNKAVRDIDWSRDGKQLLSCSYDKTAVVTDIEKGTPLCRLAHDTYTTCGKFHPSQPSYCVTGCSNEILAWDVRSPDAPFRRFRYKDNIGQVQDVLFPDDASSFFSCSDLVSRDSADRNLMAWDFNTGVTLSNQIYQERYTITRLKQHPTDRQLLAQSNANYIALFSVNRPYKMNKSKRFDGHKLLGYNVGFDITPDGASVISGSCDGKIYVYDYRSAKTLQKLTTNMNVVMDVACHPLLPSTLACCGWDGILQVWW